ncbi:hypothetical protein [Dawidia soli]|uniref:Uncharacterized protein n=1 Tax=Dawidia soli TaxID=2782352 RepID=A0AAP2D6L5_9BACT|nr:hypothetical protein [Dawidia soli]MBT1686072.1 hypothetical protein [Dawidia soli]
MSLRFAAVAFTLSFIAFSSSAQIARDFMAGGALDLIKTDNNKLLEKAQVGVECNYFVTRQFTGSAGFEVWANQGVSFAVGGRWFPVEEAFVRLRGLIGENDLSLGAGWAKPINDRVKFEAMGDFYFQGDFTIRAGIQYIIRRRG